MTDEEEEEIDLSGEIEEIKEARKKRLANKTKKNWLLTEEPRLRETRGRRPRVKHIRYDPDFDEDDYEQYYSEEF